MKNKFTILVLAICMIFVSCDPFHTMIEDEKINVQYYESSTKIDALSNPNTLDMVTWNIKFGGGRIDFFFDCHGDRVLMTKAEVMENMAGVAAKIRNMNPDVIFLQEVDIDSKRAAYVDQIQYILDNTDLNYGVYASQWKADYVPSDGVGQVNSGNAILSRFPLDNAERIALPLIGEQSGLVQYFYLRRNILLADINVSGKDLKVLNTHTSAYSTDGTKKEQLRIIEEKMSELDASGETFIIGGDFNNLPQGADLYCEFDDNACGPDSGYEPQTCDVLLEELSNMAIYDAYEAAITDSVFRHNQSLHGTFTSDKDGFWNRKLDYLFTNGDFVDFSGLVHQNTASGNMETMPLSDHAPVSTVFKLN